MDRGTEAVVAKDLKALEACYAPNAVAISPDQGRITGRENIVEYLRQFIDAFPDMRFELVAKHESDNVAIDEGLVLGTHTAPLVTPTSETIPPTGKTIRLRECDVAVVEGGLIVEHRFYYDQLEMLTQLGLAPEG